MAEYFGGDFIYSTLSTSTALSALISTNIFNARMVPKDTASLETVNFYPVIPYDPRSEVFASTWSADCRSATDSGALEIARVVVATLNRLSSAVGGYTYFAVTGMGGPIPPADDTDVYNCPVSIILRRR